MLVLVYSLSHSSIEEHVDGVCSTHHIAALENIAASSEKPAANMRMYWSAAVYHMKSGSIGHQSTTIPPTVHIFKRMLVSGYRG